MRLLLTADPEIEVPPRLYGGIERIVDVLVRRLRAAGHTVGLVARPGSECPNDAFFPWPGLSSLSKRDTVANTFALWRAVRAFKPDVVHSFSRIAYLLPHPSSVNRRIGPSGSRSGWPHPDASPSRAAATTSRVAADRRAASGTVFPTSPIPKG